MMKPCIDCGTPSNGTRCPTHAAQRGATLQASQNARRKQTGGRSKYGGTYQRGARGVRATATVCWLCGGPANPDDPWQADHLEQGDRRGGPTGSTELAAAHRSCNIRRRHLTVKGWTHQRIIERLQLLHNGPPTGNTPPGDRDTHLPHPNPPRRSLR
jgi:hypothetical protein